MKFNKRTNMVRPVETVNKEPCTFEEIRLSVQTIVMKVTTIDVYNGCWSYTELKIKTWFKALHYV